MPRSNTTAAGALLLLLAPLLLLLRCAGCRHLSLKLNCVALNCSKIKLAKQQKRDMHAAVSLMPPPSTLLPSVPSVLVAGATRRANMLRPTIVGAQVNTAAAAACPPARRRARPPAGPPIHPAICFQEGAPQALPAIKVVGMGSCGQDLLAQVASFPRPDDKLRTETMQTQVGWAL